MLVLVRGRFGEGRGIFRVIRFFYFFFVIDGMFYFGIMNNFLGSEFILIRTLGF